MNLGYSLEIFWFPYTLRNMYENFRWRKMADRINLITKNEREYQRSMLNNISGRKSTYITGKMWNFTISQNWKIWLPARKNGNVRRILNRIMIYLAISIPRNKAFEVKTFGWGHFLSCWEISADLVAKPANFNEQE